MSSPYACWQIEKLENFNSLSIQKKLEHLLNWGQLAANAHNAQMWRFQVNETSDVIKFLIAKDELLEKTDKEARQSVTSLGCLIENIMLAGHCYGLSCDLERIVNTNQLKTAIVEGIEVAQLKINWSQQNQFSGDANAILQAIKNRRSNRMKFDGKPLPEDLLAKIKIKSQKLDLNLFIVSDTATRLAISELQYMADRTVVALPGFREELLSHLISNEDFKSNRGMPGHTFGLTTESTGKLKNDLAAAGHLNPDWAVGFASAGRDGIRSAPSLLIACGDDSANAWIAAGRLFQYAAVCAESVGVASAYNAAMVESLALNAMLKIRLGTFKKPICVFRMGYPTQVMQHSPRRELSEVLEMKK